MLITTPTTGLAGGAASSSPQADAAGAVEPGDRFGAALPGPFLHESDVLEDLGVGAPGEWVAGALADCGDEVSAARLNAWASPAADDGGCWELARQRLAQRVPRRGGRNARPVSPGPSGPTRAFTNIRSVRGNDHLSKRWPASGASELRPRPAIIPITEPRSHCANRKLRGQQNPRNRPIRPPSPMTGPWATAAYP